MKVVINSKHGGFSLSPEATLECWKRGGPIEAIPVDEYYGAYPDDPQFGKTAMLAEWRRYISTGTCRLTLTVFTPDESAVLNTRPEDRAHPILVQVVEELGALADGSHASLKVVDVPDGVDWEIEEYDGLEWIAEKHRRWS